MDRSQEQRIADFNSFYLDKEHLILNYIAEYMFIYLGGRTKLLGSWSIN